MNTVEISPLRASTPYRERVQQHGSPLLLLDCQRVRDQYLALRRALPQVDLYYAIKALPHPAVVRTLLEFDAGFDIASSGEIAILKALGAAPRRTIHTHPIKRDGDIADALRFGCTTFVVDNTDELLKFLPYKHRVGLLLRLSFRSHSAVVDLSKKFGCDPSEASALLELAARLGIHVKGFSFHAGSQCSDSSEQVRAVETCNALIRQHHDTGAAPLSVLDIGGGFPVAYDGTPRDIDHFCAPLARALAALPAYVNVIAEPGRFIAAPSMTGVATVIGKALRQGLRWYYLDDGVYNSYSGQIYDHMRYPLEVFADTPRRFASVLAGPTCDSIDVIAEGIDLPELQIGDVVVGHMMGAYTMASATEFNSLKKATIVALNVGAAGAGVSPALAGLSLANPHLLLKNRL